ncbi:InlB B-repeat-containing protein [Sporosarcina sp. BP05]|uniref:InlB B-repeat-containing protein n=1 Tax=Sporosarcina sp. BP05 TaxID=2758726 RepID=UPI002104E0E9|nr:InlB B-repeat-containing protein [Sporosarcina sp. BP05]
MSSNKMWKKSKLVLLSSALAFSLTYSATNFVALAADETSYTATANITQNYLKVKFENKVLYHEQVPTKTIIQVLTAGGEVLQSEVLSSDTEMELDAPKIGKGRMLSYWQIEHQKDKIIIKPYLLEEKELSVRFYTTDGGQLLENNAQIKEIVKSVNKGTNLKDVLPEVNPKKHYKLSGWFKAVNEKGEEKLKNIDDIKITDSKGVYYAKFYPDFNDNDIDDSTEEITVKFVTNSKDRFKDVKTNVGDPIELPILKNKNSVFIGWYTDEKFQNEYKNDVLTESLTLYVKWEKADKVIADAKKNPITDKDISDQVEKILNERLNEFNANQKPSNVSGSGNDTGLIVQPKQPSQPPVEGNIGTGFKEKVYVFKNENIGQMFMVKFFDEDEGFLFSLTLPYGKTLKTYDENGKMHDEYSIRQDTTITINTQKYINSESVLLGFDTREVRVNSTQITEVFPEVKIAVDNSQIAYEKRAQEMEVKDQAFKKKMTIASSLVVLFVVIIVGFGIYLFRSKRRKSQEEHVLNV